ncbi:MAG: DUF559 domain-containing protein [Devosia sp.]
MRNDVPPNHRVFARAMRRSPTDAERRIWAIVRAGRIEGHKFRRQLPIAGYIVDFVCLEQKLIIEADGSQHIESESDMIRDAALQALGYRVLRFYNNDVLRNPDGVLASIVEALGESESANPLSAATNSLRS